MKKLMVLCFICMGLQSCGEKPMADFTWSPQNPKAGEEVHFTNLSTGAKNYSWNLGNMAISKETNPKNIYQQEGNYIVDLSAFRGLKSDMKTVTITVVP